MKTNKAWLTKKNVFLFVSLLLFWFVLSQRITVESVVIGVIVSLVVVIYSSDIAFTEEETSLYQFSKIKTLVIFGFKLIVEIIKANIDVALIVLNPSLPISPVFIKVPMMLKSDVNKVLYSNAVTLTPGTLTVDIEEDAFIIHALTKDAALGMKDTVIEDYCRELDKNPMNVEEDKK